MDIFTEIPANTIHFLRSRLSINFFAVGSRTDKAGLALKGRRPTPELGCTSFLSELQMQSAVKILDLINTLWRGMEERKEEKILERRESWYSRKLFRKSYTHPLFVSAAKMFNVFSWFDYEKLRVRASAFLIHFPRAQRVEGLIMFLSYQSVWENSRGIVN